MHITNILSHKIISSNIHKILWHNIHYILSQNTHYILSNNITNVLMHNIHNILGHNICIILKKHYYGRTVPVLRMPGYQYNRPIQVNLTFV